MTAVTQADRQFHDRCTQTKAGFLAVLTGPLEVVLQYCTTHMLLGQSKKLDNTSKKEIREQAMILQGTPIAFRCH